MLLVTLTVLAGDFNTVFNRSVDHGVSVVFDTSRKSSAALARLFKEVCCEDTWRYLHPSSSAFTWSRADGSFSSRNDLIGCPFTWVPSVSACENVTLCHVRFPIIVLWYFLYLSPMFSPLVQVHGSRMCPPWLRRSILTLFLIFGLAASAEKPFTPLWPNDGKMAKTR